MDEAGTANSVNLFGCGCGVAMRYGVAGDGGVGGGEGMKRAECLLCNWRMVNLGEREPSHGNVQGQPQCRRKAIMAG